MSTKYVVDRWVAKITAYKCTKETARSVWLRLPYPTEESYQREKDGSVFDTWAEAHAELTRRAEAKLTSARLCLRFARYFADNVRGMKPPREVQ